MNPTMNRKARASQIVHMQRAVASAESVKADYERHGLTVPPSVLETIRSCTASIEALRYGPK